MNSSLSSIQSPASSVTQTATAFSPLTPLQLSVQLGSSLPPSPATSQKDYFIKRWFSQIYALIYKYLLESIHTPFSSLFIILSPAFIVLIISIAFQSISTSQSSSIASLFSHSYNLSRLTADCTQEICSSLIYYTPNDEFHSGIMKRLTQMNGLSEKRVRGFPTPEEMSKTILINSRSIIRQSPFVGISWTSTNTTNVSLAKISYNIWADLRFADSNETPLDFSLGPHHDIPLIFTSQTRKNSAKKYTFKPNPLSFQIAIESAIISYVSNPLNLDSAGTVYDVQWDWLNFKNGTADSPIPDESQLYMRLIPLMTLGSIPLLIFSVSFLCREKQYGGLIALHRMGLYESSLLISVATVLFIFNALSAVVFSASMKIVGMFVSWPIFTAIDLSVYFVVQFCFGCFLIGCGMLISSVAGSRPGYLYLAIGTFSAIVVTSTALCFYEVNEQPLFYHLYKEVYGQVLVYIFAPWIEYVKIWIDLFTLVAGSELNNNSPVFNETLPLSLTNTLMFRTVFIRSKFDFRKLATNDTLPIKVLKNLPSTLFSVLFLSCSFLLSYILTWYLNQITSPGFRTILTESKRIQTYYGFTRSPLFPFLPSYWFGQLWKRDKHFYREDFELERQKSKLVSNVRLLKLSKSIGKVGSKNENVILDDVSLNCEYGTVSVLLGSNHAGKSTIMDIISGSSNFTSGEGFLLGYDIKTEMNSVFPLMGVMSEQDIFYPNLTIAEHLEFYARFRSINLKSDIRELMKSKLSQPPLSKSRNLYRSYALAKLNQMQLSSFENSFVHQLSDGTKRQIQLLLATIGSERILLLDEPTTSMDELARRKTWNFIRNLKRGRVIILATRDPEEADALGDSVNMLKNGRLRASGTPLFLKNRFGSGYQLSVSIRPWQPIRRTSLHKGDSRFKATELRMKAGCASKEEIELFISYAMLYLPGAQVISSVGGAIVFSIPKWNTKYIMAFLKALRKDERLEWSMSNSTLEEVFSRICLSIEGQNRDVDTISISSARTKDAEEVDFGDFSVDPELRLSKKDIMEINVDASLGRKARSKSRSPSSSKRSRTPLGPVPSFTEFIYDSTYESDLAATVISQFEAIQTATRPISMLVPPPAEVEAPNNQKNIAFQQMNAMFYKNFLLWWKEPIVNIIWIIVIALTLLASSIIPKFAFAPSVSSFPGSTCQTYFQTNANSDGKTSPLLDGPGGSCNATKLAQLMSSPPQALTNATAQFVPACYAADKSGCLPQDFTGISSDMFPFRISEAAATRPSPLSPDLIENFSRDLYQTSASRPLVWYNEAPQMDVSFAKLINDSRVTSASGYQGAGIDSRNSFKFPPYFKQIGRDINSEFGDAQLRFANDAQDNIGRCQAQFNGIRGLYTQKDTFVNTYSNAYPTFGINYRKLDLASLKMSFDFVTYPVIRTPQISNLANIVYSDSDRTIPNLVKANSTCFAASPGNSVESNGVSEMKAAQILIHSISNALLKLKTNNAAASFSGQILRMPGFYTLLSERDLKLITILTMMFFIFGTSMFLPRLVNMISKEREDGLHLRLRAIGVKSLPIWMANYCFGLLIILILAAIFTTTLLLVSVEPFSAFLRKSDQGIVVLFALLLVFWCHIQICIALFIPACFTKRVNAVIFTIVMVLLTTVSPFLLLLSDPVTGEIPIIYTCIPQIAFISLINILTVSSRTSTLPVLVFTVQFCLLVLIPTILVVIGFYLTFIRKQLDWLNQYRYWFSKPTSNPRISSEPTDSDVETEAIDIKISKGAKDGFEVATIQNFTKAQNKKTILENISLSIGYGETLGVCAINDGGKSALLAAISGMIKPTSGNVTFDSTLTLGNVGISSYHDKIWPNLTVLEHLTLYCKLVGVSKIFISGRVRYIAEVVGLSREMLNIQAGNLNNGMLRQLSIGIALTSTPKVLLLDDPAVGLDIQTKRSIWRVIDRVKRERGRAVVLATNSLKEADSLCTRVGILKDGKLGALGTPYHLKAKFSDGIQLTLRFRIKCRLPEHGSPQRENDNHMLQYFSWAEMKRLGEIHDAITTHLSPKAVVEPHLDTDFHAVLMKCNFHRGGFKSKDVNDVSWKLMVRYLIPLEGADSVLIFSRLPAICEHLAISEWEFCVPTLEDVFVQVVR